MIIKFGLYYEVFLEVTAAVRKPLNATLTAHKFTYEWSSMSILLHTRLNQSVVVA